MILDGKMVRDKVFKGLKNQIENNKLNIKLVVILVGDNEASKIYIKNKKSACERVGIEFGLYELPVDTREQEIIELICNLNDDESVTGIILQSPVPSGIDYNKCCGMINPKKDVDGFTKDNIYNLYLNKNTIMPCTVRGIIRLLDEYDINLDGAHVVIVGRGNIVGKPLALALENRNATVTLAHSHTKDLSSHVKMADIVVAACGVAKLINGNMIKDGAVVIDVGVTKIDGKIVGDIDYESVKGKASYITPNPGGVGPMTVAMILENLVDMSSK